MAMMRIADKAGLYSVSIVVSFDDLGAESGQMSIFSNSDKAGLIRLLQKALEHTSK